MMWVGGGAVWRLRAEAPNSRREAFRPRLRGLRRRHEAGGRSRLRVVALAAPSRAAIELQGHPSMGEAK
eukprot:11162898-Lingulodinium_polyedra.AAC.1